MLADKIGTARPPAGRFTQNRDDKRLNAGSPKVLGRCSLALQNGGYAHAAGGADGDQAALCLVLVENLRKRGDDARAGGGERVADRQTAAPHIEFGAIYDAESVCGAELVAAKLRIAPRFEGAQDLSGERFVNLVEIKVLKGQSRILEHPRHRIGRRHQ